MRWPTESSTLGLIPKAQVGDWRRFCRCSCDYRRYKKHCARRQNTLFSFHDPRDVAHARRLHKKRAQLPVFSAIRSTLVRFDKIIFDLQIRKANRPNRKGWREKTSRTMTHTPS